MSTAEPQPAELPPAAPLLPPAKPTLYDRWTARLVADPRVGRLWRWLAPTLITLLAAVLRLWNLGHPHALIFDETYYVKDAWTQWNLGYSATWPEDADASFVAGDTDIFHTIGSFVVHPPLGKLFIGMGMALFGAESSFGWRIAVALFGTALVLVLYLVAKSLTGSIPFASVAAGLLAIDGLGIVMSRVSLLDMFLAFFVLLTFWFVVLDHRRTTARFDAALDARDDDAPLSWGPVLWNRPWLLAAGAAVGAATAVKWSGLYVAAGLGIYLVVTDALRRRRAGVVFWPTDAAFRQGPVTFVLFIPVAFVVYLASWTSWLVTDGGYDRHTITESAAGIWSWVPLPLQNLWHYHEQIYAFHVGLTSAHGYASPAWQWPVLLRPTSMYYQSTDAGIENIYSMPNPLIWFAGVAAIIWLVWRFVMTRDWRLALVLTGVAVTYVPWLLYPERTIFQFYTVAILPFLILALTFGLQSVAGAASVDGYRRQSGQRLVWVFLIAVVLLSAFWYPILTATGVPYDFWRIHNWLPTWI